MAAKKGVMRWDGWANLLTGLGIKNRDKRLNTTFSAALNLTEGELNDLYRADGLGARIIDVAVEDMMREGFRVTGDTEEEVQSELKRIDAKKELSRVLRWASLHGGAIMVMGINDGGDFEAPLNERNVRRIEFLHVYDRWRVQVDQEDLYDDPNDRQFRQPEFYQVTPLTGTMFRVHESRVLRFEGRDVTEWTRLNNTNGWGDSDLIKVYDRLRGLGEGYAGVEHMLGDFVVSILRINNLQGLIASGKENLVRRRLDLMDMSRSILNTVLLDQNEDFQRLAMPVGGVDTVLDKLVQLLSGVTGIPVTILMGESPAGLNATGASDVRRYYDMIAARQENRLQPNLEKLVRLIMAQTEGPFSGREIDGWKIEFNPLWQPTEAEIVDMRNKQAATDQTYIDSGVLSPQEVRESRFGGDQYSIDTAVEGELDREPVETDEGGEDE